VRDNDITDLLSMNFTVDGDPSSESLCHNGKTREVTDQNKLEYLDLLVDFKLNRELESQFRMLIKGFNDVIDLRFIQQMFDEQELELVMCGKDTINISNDMKPHIKYTFGYNEQSPTIVYLWNILESYTAEKRCHFIQFVTGSPRIPLEGFKALQPMFTIQRIAETNKLPSASTCFNLLKLPDYNNENTLRDKLDLVLSYGLTGFGYS
jgi:hypothetical protein